MPIDYTAILNTIKTGIINLGTAQLKGYLPQLQADAQSIANGIKDNVENWTAQLTSGEITADDLKFLIAGNAEYLEIAALTQAGIAQIQLDQFKQGVINLIVKTLTALVP
jgi:hypothetical protein